jgi:hypothetical protein
VSDGFDERLGETIRERIATHHGSQPPCNLQ